MADADLEQLRKARLAQLQQQGGSGGGQSNEEDEQRAAESSARSSILSQILTAPSIDRLSRIRMVKESRATDVENRLIGMARSGQLRGKVDEDQLKQLLEAISRQEQQIGAGGAGGTGDGESGGSGGAAAYKVVRRGKDWGDDLDDELDELLGK